MQNKVVISIKLQKKLHYRLQQRIIEEGYGMRGKSKWINESVEHLLKLSDYPTLVEIADDMDHLSEIITVRVPSTLAVKIEEAVLFIRKQYPLIEGVKSNLIRASIVQRLLRQPTSVTEV
jgi:hypothetical protein